MKIRYFFIVCIFSLSCESSQQSQQVRERDQSVSKQKQTNDPKDKQTDNNGTGITTETGNEQNSTFNSSTSSGGLIDEEFLVPGGPTSYRSKPIEYGQGASSAHKGFYIRNSNGGSSGAGLIAIHGVKGMTEEFKRNLMRFAARGYRVLAIDLYEGRLPGEDDADSFYQSIQARGKTDVFTNITSGVDYLRDELGVTSLGVVGWDEGGYWAIETMINFPSSFAALVNFYGSPFELSKDAPNIPIPTFHIFPGDDGPETTEIRELEQTLNEKSGKNSDFRFYENVATDFLEPSLKNKDEKNIGFAYEQALSYLDQYLMNN
ncbi:MAG: dienelactone hydrolase family protein [Oligoflexales bacterium]